MKMFHWDGATCLENYSAGDIIVMAESVEDARFKALGLVDQYLKEHRSWWFNSEGKLDPDSSDDHRQWMDKFERDISQSANEREVIFISGSE